jgi:predicted ATP-grasp superfamily ATP-dependent carboligase
MNVLILDGNENQAVACVRSLGQARHTVRVGSSANWSKAGMSRWCSSSFRYPDPAESSKFIRSIVEEVQKHPGSLILPMTERTTLPISAHREELIAAESSLILPPHSVVLRTFDKLQTTELARSLGIAVPQTVLLQGGESSDGIALQLRFPIVLKPRSSFEDTQQGRVRATGRPLYARDAHELEIAWQAVRSRASSALVQEFVPGEGTGYFALMHHGSMRAEFAHLRIRDVHPSGSGSSLRVSVRPDPALRASGLKLLESIGWHGVAMVEFRRRPDGTLVFMEVNGRFWNSLALPIYSGVDFPALLARMAEEGDIAPVQSYREGVRCRWLLGDFRHLVAVWRGAPSGFPGRYPGRLRTLLNFLMPVPGTFHDNFTWRDPLPELGDWLDFFFRRVPERWRKRSASASGDEIAVGSSSRT